MRLISSLMWSSWEAGWGCRDSDKSSGGNYASRRGAGQAVGGAGAGGTYLWNRRPTWLLYGYRRCRSHRLTKDRVHFPTLGGFFVGPHRTSFPVGVSLASWTTSH